MSKHTLEPWTHAPEGMIVSMSPDTQPEDAVVANIKPKDARRIVSCVNACAGMADPAEEIAELKALSVKNILLDVTPGDGSGLEVYAKSAADVSDLLCKMDEEIAELKRQRDELLEAAKAVVTRWDTPNWKDAEPTAAVIGRLRAILQKIEGCEE